MGGRLTRLKSRSGFRAETAAAISILFSTTAAGAAAGWISLKAIYYLKHLK
ncbi:MAG: hypothetical protein JJE04_07490 [Acidobacteriia bacterium]|nr:hypothetical protein [Terriglobia bacterium]